jgi:hypothetical protein
MMDKVDTIPYPIRYQIQFSMLRYAHYDISTDFKEINYKPYIYLFDARY